MSERIKCEEKTDGGASMVRGFHNMYPCSNKAKYKVNYTTSIGDERTQMLCGVHLRKLKTEESYGYLKINSIENL